MKHDLPLFLEAEKHCGLLGYKLSLEVYNKVELFLSLLERSAGKTNLVGPSEIPRLWRRHVLESIAFVPFLESLDVVDIGTGAGFPGFILAICGFNVTAVESRGKRCAFLETAARMCGVSCCIRNSRIEEAGPFPTGSQFTSRAVKGPEEMLRLIHLAAPDGFSMLTRVADESVYSSKHTHLNKLSAPPLDREGFILQYRHPCISLIEER